MYAKPIVEKLDPTAEVATCCRVIVNGREIVNELVCPFPGPSVCVYVYDSGTLPIAFRDVSVCVLAT